MMFKNTEAFSSFSVDDIDAAKAFYADTLGVEAKRTDEGLSLALNGVGVFIYAKNDHKPATFTVLNFMTDDIDDTVNKLKEKGVKFESYTGEMATDDNNIFRGADKDIGPNIAWFTDPAGNIISVIEN